MRSSAFRVNVIGLPMKIYTRTGDRGETSLFSGERVAKDSLRVDAYGTIDELNSLLGVARASGASQETDSILNDLQNELFTAGADLATRTVERPRQPPRLNESDWRRLESLIDRLESELPSIRHFILPGGTAAGSLLHMARTVCRRGERLVVRLAREEGDVNPQLIVYLNRLSDFLFVLARFENLSQGTTEVAWKGH